MRRARQLVEEGHVGRVVKVRYILCYHANYADEARRWKVDASLPMHGALLDIGVHAADNIRFVADSRATRVYAEGGAFRPEDTDMINSGVAVMRLENGAMAEWEISETQQTGGKFPLQHTCEIYGTQGSILVAGGKLSLYSGLAADPESAYSEEEHPQDPFYQPWLDLHKDFVRCIVEDLPVPIAPEVGFDSLAVVEAIFRSIREHTVETVPKL